MKTRKFFVTLATVGMLAGMLAGCGGSKSATVDTSALAKSLTSEITYENDLNEIDADTIENYIAVEEGVEGSMYMSSGSTAEEVAVFTAPDSETAKKMESNVEAFLSDQKASFKDYIPEEAARIDEAVLVQDGNYVVLCVSGDSDNAQKIIDKAFGK